MSEFPRPPVPDDPRTGWAQPPVPVPRRSIGSFFTAYFAAGLALLAAGLITVVVLVARPSHPQPRANGPAVVPSVTFPRFDTDTDTTPPTAPVMRGNGVTLGPQLVKMGQALTVTGDDGEKFQVTVTAGKFRKSGCDPYAVKPKRAGYLPTVLKVKVLSGVPDISEFDFKFQTPDGTWLDSVGGTGCETDTTGFVRRLTAGRTYTTTVIFDVPKQPLKGDIVFRWPLLDVIGDWKVG